MFINATLRAQNRCDQPRKYCCPSVRLIDDPKFPEDCGSTPKYASDRVVGGGPIEPDEYSWVASLEYTFREETSGICEGSVVNSLYILTAAHCVTGSSVQNLGGLSAVRLGDFRNGQKCDYGTIACQHFQRIGIEKIIVHMNYLASDRVRMLNDIALVRLNQRIQFTDTLKPICLPFGGNSHIVEPTADTWLTLSGWGLTSSQNDAVAKRAVTIPLWPKSRCLSDDRRDESQLCSGIAGKGSCNGDSGGPLMNEFERKRMVLEGIVSYSSLQCATPFPSVFTRVRSFGDWIESNMIM